MENAGKCYVLHNNEPKEVKQIMLCKNGNRLNDVVIVRMLWPYYDEAGNKKYRKTTVFKEQT